MEKNNMDSINCLGNRKLHLKENLIPVLRQST